MNNCKHCALPIDQPYGDSWRAPKGTYPSICEVEPNGTHEPIDPTDPTAPVVYVVHLPSERVEYILTERDSQILSISDNEGRLIVGAYVNADASVTVGHWDDDEWRPDMVLDAPPISWVRNA